MKNNKNNNFSTFEINVMNFSKKIKHIFKNYKEIEKIEIFKIFSTKVIKGKQIEQKEYIDLVFSLKIGNIKYKLLNNKLIKEKNQNNSLRDFNINKRFLFYDNKTEIELKKEILNNEKFDNILFEKIKINHSIRFLRHNLKNDVNFFFGKIILSKKELHKLEKLMIKKIDVTKKLKI